MVNATQQFVVALGVQHYNRITSGDVLADQQFRQAGLAGTGGAENQRVAVTFGLRGTNFLFALKQAYSMQHGVPGYGFRAASDSGGQLPYASL